MNKIILESAWLQYYFSSDNNFIFFAIYDIDGRLCDNGTMINNKKALNTLEEKVFQINHSFEC